MILLQSQPCKEKTVPQKVEVPKNTKTEIVFSPNWLHRVQDALLSSPSKTWQIVSKQGVKIRALFGDDGGVSFSDVPTEIDFPIVVEPVPDEVIREEQLEQIEKEELLQIQLEEELLAEMIRLSELEEKDAQDSALNPTIPASSALAPSAAFAQLSSTGPGSAGDVGVMGAMGDVYGSLAVPA